MSAKKKDNVVKDVLILLVITLCAGLLLGAAYTVTKAPIAKAQAEQRAQSQRAVMEDADSFVSIENVDYEAIQAALDENGITKTSVTAMDEALDASGERIGYVVTATNAEGYGGDVELMCGILSDGEGGLVINGISFLTLAETAGMGMRAKDAAFADQFKGKMLEENEPVVYTKNEAVNENEVDVISGCTVTTSAVVKDVNAALIAVRVTERGAK